MGRDDPLGARMADLYDTTSNRHVGSISDEELQFLIDALEEESSSDDDYYVDGATIEMLEERGATAHLLGVLRAAVGTSEGVDLRWERR
jgi:hypothetical protein